MSKQVAKTPVDPFLAQPSAQINIIKQIPYFGDLKKLFTGQFMFIVLLVWIIGVFCIVNIIYQSKVLRKTWEGDVGIFALYGILALKTIVFTFVVIFNLTASKSSNNNMYYSLNLLTWFLFIISILFISVSASRKKQSEWREYFWRLNPALTANILLLTAFVPAILFPGILGIV